MSRCCDVIHPIRPHIGYLEDTETHSNLRAGQCHTKRGAVRAKVIDGEGPEALIVLHPPAPSAYSCLAVIIRQIIIEC